MFTKRIIEIKKGKKWINCESCDPMTDPADVYRALASEMIAKKINHCSYIKTIRRVQRYTHVEIIVSFDNDTRAVYTLPAHF